MKTSPLIINEHPIAFLPNLAMLLGGSDPALVLQQIHYWISNKKIGEEHDGSRWVRNTLEQWQQDNFPWMSIRTVRRILDGLQNCGILKTGNFNKITVDRTLWYTIDYDILDQWSHLSETADHLSETTNQVSNLDKPHVSNLDTPLPETTETTKDSSANKSRSKKPKIEKPAKEKPTTPYTAEIKNKLSEICFGRIDAWKTDASGLGKALRELSKIEPDLSVEKLNEFELRYMKLDWRWKEHQQRPEPYQVVPAWLKYMPGEGSSVPEPPQIDWSKVDWDKIPSIPSNAAGGKRPEEWDQPSYDSTHLDHILDDDEEVPF